MCNFFCCSNTAFKAHGGFASVTTKSAAATITLQGIRLKLIDTPGFCDDYETEEEHMKEFGQALVLASKGVNAIGLVISAKDRYTTNETNTIKYMTEFPDLWPYMFIIFTKAGPLGADDEMRMKKLQENLKKDRCPQPLQDLVKKVRNRYIVIESVKPSSNPEAYYQHKTKELYAMIMKLHDANGHKLYTNALFVQAKELIDKLVKEKEAANEELQQRLADAKINVQKRIGDQEYVAQAKQHVEIADKEREAEKKKREEKNELLKKQVYQEVKDKEEEATKAKQERDQHSQERQKLQEQVAEGEEKRRILEEAQEDAIRILKERLVHERKVNDELKQKRDRRWYKVLFKKTTGSECVIQ